MVLYRRPDDSDLLPSHLSGQARQVPERCLLSHCRRGRAGGFPPLLTMSPRDGPGDTGLERCGGERFARPAAHRGWFPRRWQGRRASRRAARHDEPSSAPTVRAARGCFAHRGGNEPAGATREEARRRDRDADVRRRVRRGVREHPAIQRRLSRRVQEVADGGPPSEAPARERQDHRPSVIDQRAYGRYSHPVQSNSGRRASLRGEGK
jgi:hypothetical protein